MGMWTRSRYGDEESLKTTSLLIKDSGLHSVFEF